MTQSFFFHSLRGAILTLIVEGLSEALKMKYFLLDSLTYFKIEESFWAICRIVLFCFKILLFSPNFMAQFAKGICFPYLICLTFREKNISKVFNINHRSA